jgi:glycosyltransferase involved in cell wall biosynthesis
MDTMASAGRKRRRTCIVVQNLPVPFDRRVWLEATTLAKAGWEVSVISPQAEGFTAPFEQREGVDIYRYYMPDFGDRPSGFVKEFLWAFVQTGRLLSRVARKKRGYDVLHVCNPPETFWPYGLVGKLFRTRFIFDHHDLSPEMYSVKYGRESGIALLGLRLLERLTFAVADVVITTNRSHQRVAIERGGKRAEDVFIVRSGPDLSRLVIYPPDDRLRQGKKHLLAYLGEICKQDGVDHLVRAVKILRDEFERDDFHCILVGGGPHQPEISAYATELGVDELCTFTGRVSDDELCRVLSSADLGLDPGPKNPWSDKSTMNKIMEYMFFGLPIVAYDLAETRVSAGGAAAYATGSESDLAQQISDLLDDADRRKRMGEVGFGRVRSELAWDYSVPQLLDAYEQANQRSG